MMYMVKKMECEIRIVAAETEKLRWAGQGGQNSKIINNKEIRE